MAKLLEKEVSFYESHKTEFEKRYPGRYLLIHGRKLHGDYASFEKAVKVGLRGSAKGRSSCSRAANKHSRSSSCQRSPTGFRFSADS